MLLDEAIIPAGEVFGAFSVIEESVQTDCMDLLFPLAIDYTRAFLEFYFRERIEVVPAGSNRFRLRSLTGRAFQFTAGTVMIAYDGEDGQRHGVPVDCGFPGDEVLELRAPTTAGELASLSTFTCVLPSELPVAAADRFDFWVVLRGEPLGRPGNPGLVADLDDFDSSSGIFEADFSVAFARVRGRMILFDRVNSPLAPAVNDEDRMTEVVAVGVNPETLPDPPERANVPRSKRSCQKTTYPSC